MVVCILLASVARVVPVLEMEKNAWALGSIFGSLQLLIFILPYKFFGTIVISLYKMLVNDIRIFLLIYAVLHLAFSLALSLSFVKSPVGIMPPTANFATRFPAMMLYQFWTGMDNLSLEELEAYARNLSATQTLHLTFVVLFNVLGLNLIIAMMGKTFANDMDDVHRLWLFPFANLVLHLERNLSKAQRANCAAYRCGSDPDASAVAAPEIEEHDASFDEAGNGRLRGGQMLVPAGACEREFFLVQQEQVARHGEAAGASGSGALDGPVPGAVVGVGDVKAVGQGLVLDTAQHVSPNWGTWTGGGARP